MQIEVKKKCHRRFWRLDFRRYSDRKTAIIDFDIHFDRDLWSRGRLLRSRSFGRPDLRAGARVFAPTPSGAWRALTPDFVSLTAARKQLRRYRNQIRSEHRRPAGTFQ